MDTRPFPAVAVRAVLAGRVRPFRGPEAPSAIAKAPLAGPVAVGFLGLAGDEQADREHHGGRDKALHHYPLDHYDGWRGDLGDHPLLAAPGGFGENISTLGLVEDGVLLGDRFRLGTALVEVSQGRQPCWKLDHRFGRAGVAARMTASGRSGWYCRVLEEGTVRPGDRLELVERGLAAWTVARLFAVLVGGGHGDAPGALEELAGLEVLAGAWRRRAADLLAR